MKPNELRNKINERNWELLLDAINEGKVVPIIGEDLIIQLVHVLSYDKAATVAWILLEGLYGMQKTWSFMAPVYKQMLEYIHKE